MLFTAFVTDLPLVNHHARNHGSHRNGNALEVNPGKVPFLPEISEPNIN